MANGYHIGQQAFLTLTLSGGSWMPVTCQASACVGKVGHHNVFAFKELTRRKAMWMKPGEHLLSTCFLSSSLSACCLSTALPLRGSSRQILPAFWFCRFVPSILSECLCSKHFAVWKKMNLRWLKDDFKRIWWKKSVWWDEKTSTLFSNN